MINRLMLSVAAAALIAGTGFANAQGNMGREAPAAGSATQQSAPAADRAAPAAPSAATPMNRDSDSAAPAGRSAQSDEKTAPAAKGQRAQGDMKAGPQGEKSAQDNNPRGGDRSKSMNSENEKGSPAKDMKAEGREDRMNAEQKGADSKRASDSKTVGQAGAGAKLSGEQRTKITTVIRNQHVAPVTNVNFSISVGTRVPRDVRFNPLPEEIVSIYPDWRGYEFILVGDQIVVVDPQTFEIVAVIEA
jgi:hypothetical protein